MRSAALILSALLALATQATAAAADVISAAPQSVAVTIYRDEAINEPAAVNWAGYGLGMISETRVVDLPAGDSRLVFEGVADGALPETAVLKGFAGHIVEQNFDFNLLTPGSLAQHAIGQTVHVVRTNPRTGKAVTEDAVLRAAPNGVVADYGGGRIEALQCSGGLEGLVFDHAPPELTGKATLSTRVRVTRPGRYVVTLSYLTIGLAWKASYVARLAPDGQRLDLNGWITLANHGQTTYPGASTSVVAGRLARQAVRIVNRVMAHRETGCWASGNSHHPQGESLYLAQDERDLGRARGGMMLDLPAPAPPPVMAMSIAAKSENRMAQQSDLGDYKLYTLPGPTTVAARQTKQVMFLALPGVKFDKVFVYKVALGQMSAGEPAHGPAVTTLRFENKPVNGLGRALPAGAVSLRQPLAADGGREQFLGAPALRDVPIGEPFELEVGAASDVQVTWRVVSSVAIHPNGRNGQRLVLEAVASNAKPGAVAVELRHQVLGRPGFKVTGESQAHGTKGGDPVWTLALAANARATLTYTVEQLDY